MTEETQPGPIEPDDTTVIPDDGETKMSELAWSRDETEELSVRRRPHWLPIALVGAAAVALIGVSVVYFTEHKSAPSTAPLSVRPSPTIASAAAAPPPATITVSVTPPATSTVSEASAPFLGEWGQHATSVTLEPGGTAHYVVTSGAMNSTSWSATWSPTSATTAKIFLTSQLESQGDTDSLWLHRYPGEAFTFALRSDGYATITAPSGEPITLCPRGTGFHDTQGLCGA